MQILFLSEELDRPKVLAARLAGSGIDVVRRGTKALDEVVLPDHIVAIVVDSRAVGKDYKHALSCIGRSSSQFVIALVGDDEGERSAAWGAGVNVCLSRDIDVAELAAALQVLATKRIRADPPNVRDGFVPAGNDGRGVWRLGGDGVTLIAPTGVKIVLSPREGYFIELLMAHHGSAVDTRDGLQLRGPGATRKWFLGRRTVPMVVCRLRRKLARLGLELPVRTIYGVGYSFTQERTLPQNTREGSTSMASHA